MQAVRGQVADGLTTSYICVSHQLRGGRTRALQQRRRRRLRRADSNASEAR